MNEFLHGNLCTYIGEGQSGHQGSWHSSVQVAIVCQ